MSTVLLIEELIKLNPSALLELFEIDLSVIGASLAPIRFHNGTNSLTGPIQFQGLAYNALPIRVAGFEVSTQGAPPRPSLTMANIGSWLSGVMRPNNDFIGAKLIRRRTYARFLDGAPEASPEFFPDDVFFITRKIRENRTLVEWECSSPLDMDGIAFPRRQVMADYCGWRRYRGPGCGYAEPVVIADNRNGLLPGGEAYSGLWNENTTYKSPTSVRFKNAQGVWGVYKCLSTLGISGLIDNPDSSPNQWLRLQRDRGQFNPATIDYVAGDVVWLITDAKDGVKTFAIAVYTGGLVPPNTDPLASSFWKLDWCVKNPLGCRYRFDPLKSGQTLPYGGFPGVANLPYAPT